MPMIYRNLEHTDDMLIPHLRGIYRYTWMKNQRHLLKMQQVVGQLNKAGIDSIMLKGMPLSMLYYKDMGVRLMSDLDVLVPTLCADDARQLIQQPPLSLKVSQYETRHRHQLHAMHGWDTDGIDVDLHWNLMNQHAYTTADAPFWRERRPVTLPNGATAYTLSPTHQLFHLLVHGSPLWYANSLLRWIPDSLTVCRHPDLAIDWTELIELAHQYRLTIPIQHGLQFLADTFALTLPDSVHRWLQNTRPTTAEQTYFTLLPIKSSTAVSKAYRFVRKQQLAYALFRKGKPGPSLGHWFYRQVQMRYDWKNHDLPFDV